MLLGFLLFCCLSAPAEVSVDSDIVTLGSLIPFPPGDPRAAISLGYSPNPGLGRRIYKQDIFAKLQAAGSEIGDLSLPDSILVRRTSQNIDKERVTQAILEAFIRQYPDANIEILSVDVPVIHVGTGSLELSASLSSRLDVGKSVFVRLDVRGAGFARTLFVRTNVRIESVQPVLLTRVGAQSSITPDQVEWRPAPVASFREIIKSADQFSGMLLKRDIEAGSVLTPDLLYSPLYVQRGDAVTVKATAGTVTIAATMRAKGAGRFGDSIVVEHLTGSGTTTARVVGPRLLEVLQETR
jgi:flagella basal body P-ring formation protein FlgA